VQNARQSRRLPGVVQIRNPALHVDKVEEAVAYHLVGDVLGLHTELLAQRIGATLVLYEGEVELPLRRIDAHQRAVSSRSGSRLSRRFAVGTKAPGSFPTMWRVKRCEWCKYSS